MYPEESLQGFISSPQSPWWVTYQESNLKRGELLNAFVPHVDQIPSVLIPEGRLSPTDHTSAKYKIKPLRIKQPSSPPKLPVAALPSFEGELRSVYRVKKRPVLLLSTGGMTVPRKLRPASKPRWQTSPTILVAPYYGAEQKNLRAGWYEKLVDRIKCCEYPQYLWDILPLGHTKNGSILRLDHLMPIGNHHDSFERTGHCISEEAMIIIDEWLFWLITGKLPEDAIILDYRNEYLKQD